MNFKKIFFSIVLTTIWVVAATAQAPVLAAKNRTLTAAEKSAKEQAAQTAAYNLANALQSSNQTEMKKFIPDKATYKRMAESFSYTTEGDRQKSLKSLEQNYTREYARVLKTFTDAQPMLQSGSLQAQSFQIKFEDEANFPGGRAAIVYKDSQGQQHVLRFYKFYEFEGKWYVISALRWV